MHGGIISTMEEEWGREAEESHYQQGGYKLEHGHELELHGAPDRVSCVLPTVSHGFTQHPQGLVPQGLKRDGRAEAGWGFCRSSRRQSHHKTGG